MTIYGSGSDRRVKCNKCGKDVSDNAAWKKKWKHEGKTPGGSDLCPTCKKAQPSAPPTTAEVLEKLKRAVKKDGFGPEVLGYFEKVIRAMGALGSNPSWAGFQKAARLVAKEWGAGAAARFHGWLKMFLACLDVEVGISEDEMLARMQRRMQKALLKQAPGDAKLGDYLSSPADLPPALQMNGDVTITPRKGRAPHLEPSSQEPKPSLQINGDLTIAPRKGRAPEPELSNRKLEGRTNDLLRGLRDHDERLLRVERLLRKKGYRK